MRKKWLAAAIALVVLLSTINVASAEGSRKMTTPVFNKKLAELAKASTTVKKQQNNLLASLNKQEQSLSSQLVDIMDEQDAAGYTSTEIKAYFSATIDKLSRRDDAISEYFLPDEMDLLSSYAGDWLSSSKLGAKLRDNNSKLGSSYYSLVKEKKYQDALNARNQQIALDKRLNSVYQELIDIEKKIDLTLYDVLHPQLEDDQSNTNDDWDDGYDSYPSSGNSVRGDVYN
jgi:hypothetical protein